MSISHLVNLRIIEYCNDKQTANVTQFILALFKGNNGTTFELKSPQVNLQKKGEKSKKREESNRIYMS